MELMMLGGSCVTLHGREGLQDPRTLALHAMKISSTVVIGFYHQQHDRAMILRSAEYAWSRFAPPYRVALGFDGSLESI
jgi:hypothetical protein